MTNTMETLSHITETATIDGTFAATALRTDLYGAVDDYAEALAALAKNGDGTAQEQRLYESYANEQDMLARFIDTIETALREELELDVRSAGPVRVRELARQRDLGPITIQHTANEDEMVALMNILFTLAGEKHPDWAGEMEAKQDVDHTVAAALRQVQVATEAADSTN